jgi:hypothetical protein
MTEFFQPPASAAGGFMGIRLDLVLQLGGFVLCGLAQIVYGFLHGGGRVTCPPADNLEPRAEVIQLARKLTNANNGICDAAAQGLRRAIQGRISGGCSAFRKLGNPGKRTREFVLLLCSGRVVDIGSDVISPSLCHDASCGSQM